MAQLFATYLEVAGMVVTLAREVVEGIAAVIPVRPDVVPLDATLSGIP